MFMNRHQSAEPVGPQNHLNWLLPTLTVGMISGIINLIFEVSYAALIFSGPLSEYVMHGVGLTLFGTCMLGIIIALTSSFPGMVACPMGAPISILALTAATIASQLSSSAPEHIFLTVVAAIVVSSVLTGIVFLILGHFKLGDLIRFIPYPVVGGFLAGVGWLVIKGAIGIMTDVPLRIPQLPALFRPDVLIHWLPAGLFAILLLLIGRRYTHYLILPGMLLAAIAVFYLILFVTGTPMAEAKAQGWLLEALPTGKLWQPFLLSAVRHADWSVIIWQGGNLGAVVLMSLLSLLLYASAIEITARKDMDLNHELQIAGIANIVAGLFGSPVGFHNLSNNILALEMGAHNRLMGLCSAVVCGIPLFFGAAFLTWVPKPVIGGLLIFVGLSFVIKWVYDAWFTLPLVDYMLLLVILGTVGTFGFLQGVSAGTLIAIMLFVVKYSRINVIKHILSGATYHSTVERAVPYQRMLQEQGEQITIFSLQGFLFFGTANTLLNQIRRRIYDPEQTPLHYLILDFRRVNGIDSSARMKQLAEVQQFALIFTRLSPDIRRQFEVGGHFPEKEPVIRVFPDIDYGLEWCEEQILHANDTQHKMLHGEAFIEAMFEDVMQSLEHQERVKKMVSEMMDYLEWQEFAEGEYLIRQGDQSEYLYFIESGQVAVRLEHEDGTGVRLRKMGTGNIVGEIAVYLGFQASASVVATESGTGYRLSKQRLQQMQTAHPELAATFHIFIACLLGERLVHANNLVHAFQK